MNAPTQMGRPARPVVAAGECAATEGAQAAAAVVAPAFDAIARDLAMAPVTPLAVGDRVIVVEVLDTFEARYHLMGKTGTVRHVKDRKPRAPYVVVHDDGQLWAYGRRSLQIVEVDADRTEGSGLSGRASTAQGARKGKETYTPW